MAEERTRSGVAAYILIAMNLIVFAIELIHGAGAFDPSPSTLVDLGANFPPLTLRGEEWRVVSSMFLHFGVLHVGLNMFGLYQMRSLEIPFGRLGFLALYLTGGLIGGVASTIASPDAVGAGASGAVFGAFGGYAAFLVLRRADIPQEIWRKAVREVVFFLGLNLALGLSIAVVSLAAHAAGLVTGFVVGAALLAGSRPAAEPGAPPPPRRHHGGRAVALLASGVLLTCGALWMLDPPADVAPVIAELDRVEEHAGARMKELYAQTPDPFADPKFADAVEHDIVGAWIALAAQIAALDEPPARLRPTVAALRTYAAAQVSAWQAMVVAYRATPETRDAQFARYQAESGAVDQAAAVLKSRLDALRR